MTDPTPLTPESEALLAHASIRARFLNDVTMGKPRPGSIPWLRDELIAIEAAVTARVLADVAARLPEALHDNPVGEAIHEDHWAMRYPMGVAADECRACQSAARVILSDLAPRLAHLTGGTDR